MPTLATGRFARRRGGHLMAKLYWKNKQKNHKYIYIYIFFQFIYLLWKSESTSRGGQRNRDRENPKPALHCQCTAWHGARTYELWDHDLSWNGQLTLNQLSHPGALKKYIFKASAKSILAVKFSQGMGRLGGSVGWVANYSSGHDLMVCEFEPSIRLCADSSEPGAYFGFCVSLSLCPFPSCSLSLSLSKIINTKKKLF